MRIFLKKSFLFLIFWFIVSSSFSNLPQKNSSFGGFIENKGQVTDQNGKVHSDVLYLFESQGIIVQLKRNSFSYEVRQEDTATKTIRSHRIDIYLQGSNPSPGITASEPYGDYINFYLQHCSESGILFVKHYKKITYSEIYPGIDLVFHEKTTENGEHIFKYDFIVRKGGKLNDIRLEYKGTAGKLAVENNKLRIPTSMQTLEEEIPESWQFSESGDKIKSVKAFYHLNDNIVSFNADGSDNELVIDPTLVRVWASYYGDLYRDAIVGVDFDSNNNYYICGYTASLTNMATSGAFQTSLSGILFDGMIIKFDSAGNRIWATYYGGPSEDRFNDIKVYNTGNIYIAGVFGSPGMATAGVQQITAGGSFDIFLAKFNLNGTRIWATYYGGSGWEEAYQMVGDASENIFLAGYASSTALATLGTFQYLYGGGTYDGFLCKFNSSGYRLWATYYGGLNYDVSTYLNLDQSGNIYLAGTTQSSAGFASTGSFNGGSNDGFIAKISPSGQGMWCRYYGGNGYDYIRGIEPDPFGNLYITGTTSSTNNIATSSASQFTYGGGTYDGFVMKLDTAGNKIWGTYIGGSGEEESVGMILKTPYKGFYIQGWTSSPNNIATSNGYQQTYGGGTYDYFLSKFDTNGQRCYGTYYGGSEEEKGFPGINIDRQNRVVGTGYTTSTSGIATTGAFQTVHHGNWDGMIIKFVESQTLSYTNPSSLSICANQPATFTVTATSGYLFQWFRNGKKLIGATNSNLTISHPQITDTGLYSCYIYQPCYGVMTNPARLILYATASSHSVNDTTQCFINNHFIFRFTVSTVGKIIKWYFGDGTFSTGDSAIHYYTKSGIYIYSVTVRDTLYNCYDSIAKKIYVYAEPFDISQNTRPDILTDSLIAYYPFEGNTIDYSGRNHHANNFGTVSDTGICDLSRSFNGSTQYAEVPYHPDFEPGNRPMTYACWVKTDSRNTVRVFIDWYRCGANPACGNGDMAAVSLSFDANNYLVFSIRDDANQSIKLTGPNTLTDNKWHFIAGIFDPVNDSAWLYWDNCHISSVYTLGNLSAGNIQVPFDLGRIYITGWGSPQSYFYGNLDEIRVYRKSLSASDLQNIYHACKPLDIAIVRATVCLNDTGIINIINPQEGIDYTLYDITHGVITGSVVNGSCANPVVLKTNALQNLTSFKIRAINPHTGCEIFLDTIITFSIKSIQAKMSVNDTIHCRDGNLFTFRSLTDTTRGQLSYYWQTGDGYTNAANVFSHHYHIPGNFKIRYLVTDVLTGCKDSLVSNIRVYSGPFNLNENLDSFVPTDSLVAYYPFNSNAQDYSGKNHHATAGGWSLSSAECSSGSARFNGTTQYAEASSHSDFEPRGNAITLSCWFKTSATGKTMMLANWYRCGAIPTCSAGRDGATYQLKIMTNRLVFVFRDDATIMDSIVCPKNLIDNKWHFVTCIFDPVTDSAWMYYDNCVVSKSYRLGAMTAGGYSIPFDMARQYITGWGSPAHFFNGDLDEVRLYRRALTNDEVQALYHNCRKLNVSITDTALCANTNATVTIYNPQSGVNYSFYDITHNTLVNTQPGTCKDSIVFNTGLINSSVNFNIHARQTLTNCEIILDSILRFNTNGKLKTRFSVNDSSQCLKSNSFIFQNNTDSTAGAITYQWKFGDGLVSALKNPVHHYNSAGTYRVKLVAVSTNGCSDSIEKSVIVFTDPHAGFTIPDTSQCAKMNIFLFNNTSDSNNLPVNYYWNFGDSNSSASKSTSHHYSLPGTFTVWMKITDINGCMDSLSKKIRVFDSPSALFTISLDTCTGLFHFKNLSSYSDKYLWDFGDGKNDTTTNTTHTYTTINTYNVRLFSSLNGECPDTFTFPASYFYKNPYDLLGPNISICTAKDIVLKAVKSKNYNWSTGATTQSILVKPATSTWYFLTVTDSFNCTVKDSILVTPKTITLAQFNVNDLSQCIENNHFRFFLLTDSNLLSQVYWDFGDGFNSSLFNPDHVYGAVGTYPVKLVIISNDGCSDTMVKSVITTPESTADFSYSMDSCSSMVQFLNNSLFADKYYWAFGDSKSDTAARPLHDYKTGGKYRVVLYTEYQRNCRDTFSMEINVGGHDKLMYIPNAFSPNGDGNNDTFIISISDRLCMGKLTLMIYDRWGEELYSTSGTNLLWDGKYKGTAVPAGIYVYILQGNIIKKVGTVHVLR